MEVQKFCASQIQLANALRKVIDAYVEGQITNAAMTQSVEELVDINRDKFYKNGAIRTKLKNLIGKKRLEIVLKVLQQVKGGTKEGGTKENDSKGN